jgi:hypothetical protein
MKISTECWTGKKRWTCTNSCPSVSWLATNLIWTGSRSNPDCQGERPKSKCLSHRTAKWLNFIYVTPKSRYLMSMRTLSVGLMQYRLFAVRTSQTSQYTLSPKCAVFLWKLLVRKWSSCCRQTLHCDVETPGPGTAVETTRTVSDYCYKWWVQCG